MIRCPPKDSPFQKLTTAETGRNEGTYYSAPNCKREFLSVDFYKENFGITFNSHPKKIIHHGGNFGNQVS